MKIDYKHLIIFVLLFVTFQYILCYTEMHSYLNMLSDIQGYRFT